MLENKKLKEAENRVKQYLNDGVVKTKGKPEHTDFFLKKKNSKKFIY